MSRHVWLLLATTALGLGGTLALTSAAAAEELLVVDQLGYPAGWKATALLVADAPPAAGQPLQPVKVVRDETGAAGSEAGGSAGSRTGGAAGSEVGGSADRHKSGEPAGEARVGRAVRDPDSGDWISPIELPRLPAGRYRLVRGALRSPPFFVGGLASDKRGRADSRGLYDSLARGLLRAFYLQRCGVALDDAHTGARHAACHLEDAVLAPSAGTAAVQRPTTGGWHDAGDFGKYVATTAVAIGRFLHAYERDPLRHGFDDLGIPESGNGIPDLLDEMQLGLDWMLTMQRSDGAVYRKVGGAQWPKKVMPEKDAQPRFIYGVTSPETAKAAAAWAMAARLYKKSDPMAAARYLEAARRAWHWLEEQPAAAGQVFDWRTGDDSGSGPYKSNEVDVEASLTYDRDDRLWTVTELALTTGEEKWFALVRELAKDAPVNIYEWKDASLLALSYFLWHPAFTQGRPTERALAKQIARRIRARAAAPLAQAKKSGYRIANARYVWGSNKMTAEEGVLLCTAYGLAKKRELREAARDQLHYLLGRNHFSTSFVSGFGARAVRHPTHIFAQAAQLELPGLFVGGPNDAEPSKIAPQHRGPLSWIDDARSYATNEFAIDYNASLYGLLAELARDCAR